MTEMINIDEREFNDILNCENKFEHHLNMYPKTIVKLDNGQQFALIRADVSEHMMRELDQFEADHYNRQIGCIDCHD